MPGDSIDLGLAILAARAHPGERFTPTEIAAWCDCHPAAIVRVEKLALAKLRRKLGSDLPELLRAVSQRGGSYPMPAELKAASDG